MSRISAIISNKNNGQVLGTTLKNLENIKTKYNTDIEIIVVDNNSNDNSVEIIKSFDSVKLINSEDKGLSAANNMGAKEASGEFLLFLSPDGYPRPSTIKGVADYLSRNPQVGIATPRISLKGGIPDYDAHRAFPTPWNSFTRLTGLYKLFPKSKVFNSYYMSDADLNKAHEIDACVFGFMMIPAKVYTEIEGFDADYYAFGEDLDICYRVKQAGYKVMYLPQWEAGRVESRRNASETTLKEKVKLARASTQAMRVFVKKNYKGKYSLITALLIFPGTYFLQCKRVLGTYLNHFLGRN